MKTFKVTVSEPFLIVTELMANGALNKFLQTPVGQTLSQMVIYCLTKKENNTSGLGADEYGRNGG